MLAEDNTADAVLKAMREGRSVVTNSPSSTMIYLTCGDAVIGDSVPFEKGKRVDIKLTNLFRHHKVTVFNNKTPIFSFDSGCKKYKEYSFSCEVKEKGFVREEVTYEYKGIAKKTYKFAEEKYLGCKNTNGFPPFIRAFTNPIWFE